MEIEKKDGCSYIKSDDKSIGFNFQRKESRKDIGLLTPAEKKVLVGLLSGYTIKTLAAMHGRSTKTISAQKRSMMKKFGIRSDIEIFQTFTLAKVKPGLSEYSGYLPGASSPRLSVILRS